MPYASMKYMDTSDDLQTAWYFRGHDELGVAPMLDQKVNWRASGFPVTKMLKKMSSDEKQMIREELQENPRFKMLVDAARQTRNPRKALKLSAQRALVNELDSKQYPESRETWKKLRKKFRKGIDALPGIIEKELGRSKTMKQRVAYLKAYAKGGERVNLGAYDEQVGGMGFLELIGTLASTAAGIYGKKLTADVSKDIAKIQASAVSQTTAAQMAIAEAQQAIAFAQVKQAQEVRAVEEARVEQKKIAGVITAEVAGIPMWAIILAILAIGGGAYLFLK